MGEKRSPTVPPGWTEPDGAGVLTYVLPPGNLQLALGSSSYQGYEINLLLAFQPWFCGCSCPLPELTPTGGN